MSPSIKSVLILFACLTQALLAGGRDLRSDLDSNDNKFADKCDLSNETSTIDPNEVFKCRSGHEISVAMLCDGNSDCADMEDEYGCVDCINRYNEDGYYTNDSRICIQNQSDCMCVQVDCYEKDSKKQYQPYPNVTTNPGRNSEDRPITYTSNVYYLLFIPFFLFLLVGAFCGKICDCSNNDSSEHDPSEQKLNERVSSEQ